MNRPIPTLYFGLDLANLKTITLTKAGIVILQYARRVTTDINHLHRTIAERLDFLYSNQAYWTKYLFTVSTTDQIPSRTSDCYLNLKTEGVLEIFRYVWGLDGPGYATL